MKRKMAPSSTRRGAATPGLTRRDLLKGAVGLGLAATLPGCGTVEKRTRPASADRIRRENEKPGTRDW